MRGIAGSIVLTATLSAAASWNAGAGEVRVLRVSLNAELRVLDPIVTTINATRVFAYMVFDMLVGVDHAGHHSPQMVAGWQTSDDRLSYTFRIRDGLVWSDGMPVTAKDCVASVRRWAKREAIGARLMQGDVVASVFRSPEIERGGAAARSLVPQSARRAAACGEFDDAEPDRRGDRRPDKPASMSMSKRLAMPRWRSGGSAECRWNRKAGASRPWC